MNSKSCRILASYGFLRNQGIQWDVYESLFSIFHYFVGFCKRVSRIDQVTMFLGSFLILKWAAQKKINWVSLQILLITIDLYWILFESSFFGSQMWRQGIL